MSLKLTSMQINGTEPGQDVDFIEIFVSDGQTVEQSQQWICARVKVGTPSMKSLALLELAAVRKVRDLLTEESERLSGLYQQAEQAHR
jgi:hypothetical protein